ncbi:putative LRR receptor-like serine/threonine-protein kinase [Heracleum sosnowskyi]|uniref:LRR receptor-like serine/threonine-protein kinase n=1 Tax=Heracleum sosnowskyi TaxID=360622 RepID=A0AAD8I6P9_9APIA|nr:putative LRR receptor-like serine/threonine-protein kinase [Heracleum sosnowskyi]
MKKSYMFLVCLSLLLQFSNAQIASSETNVLLQVQQLLEYPQVLQGWNNWTNFCSLPPLQSLAVVCSGLWGPLPRNIDLLGSLEVLNVSSNQIYGNIPASIAAIKNLKNLVLADNMLYGRIPNLKSLQNLEELDLGNNHLGPRLPSLSDNVVSVTLKNNSLRFEIPSVLQSYVRLERLDVSSNKLSGPIPPFLFSLQSMRYLSLSRNHLSGELATNVSCNENLVYVDISNNFLIGKLPLCIQSNSPNRTVISLWNCLSNSSSKYQHRYSFCQKQALAVKPPAMDQKKRTTMKLGIVLSIIGATVGTVCTIGILVFIIYRRNEAAKAGDHKNDGFIFDKNPARGSPIVDSRHRPQTMRRMATFGLPPYQIFTWEEIHDASNNFDSSNLVGEDSQGQVYNAWLRDGSSVLLKCMNVKQKHTPQIMKQYNESLSKLRHQNLVSVLGHCIVNYAGNPNLSTIYIVQEFSINGSLRDHLKDWRKREVLKWPQRMGIIIGIAKGIQYLHKGTAPGHFGNNIKIKNIMLDENLTPKISSYTLPLPSKVGQESPLNREVKKSEFAREISLYASENPEKDDIYQFGIILLQVITGKLFNSRSEIAEMKLQLETNLTEALPGSSPKISDAADPSLRGTFAYGSLKIAIQITVNCLGDDPNTRPSIDDILWHLQYSIQVQEGWNSSGNLDTKI